MMCRVHLHDLDCLSINGYLHFFLLLLGCLVHSHRSLHRAHHSSLPWCFPGRFFHRDQVLLETELYDAAAARGKCFYQIIISLPIHIEIAFILTCRFGQPLRLKSSSLWALVLEFCWLFRAIISFTTIATGDRFLCDRISVSISVFFVTFHRVQRARNPSVLLFWLEASSFQGRFDHKCN